MAMTSEKRAEVEAIREAAIALKQRVFNVRTGDDEALRDAQRLLSDVRDTLNLALCEK